MIIFKNFFSFVLTFYAFDWVTMGLLIKWTIVIIASIQVIVCLTSIPMCKFPSAHHCGKEKPVRLLFRQTYMGSAFELGHISTTFSRPSTCDDRILSRVDTPLSPFGISVGSISKHGVLFERASYPVLNIW